MSQRSSRLLAAAVILLASVNAPAQDKALEGEMKIGPIQLVHEVAGASVDIPATTYLTFKKAEEGYHLRGRTFIDLSALQAAAEKLLSGLSLPTDNCARYALDNLVLSLRNPRVSVNSEKLHLQVDGAATVWQCIENSIRKPRIEWTTRRLPGGKKVRVPRRVEARRSAPIKNHLPTQRFVVTVSFEPYVSVGDRVALRRLPPSVELVGDTSQVIELFLGAFGVDLSQKAEGVLSKAIPPTTPEALLPEAARPLHPRILKAQFIDDGKPKLELHIEGAGSGAQIAAAMKLLVPPKATSTKTSAEPPTASAKAVAPVPENCRAMKTLAEIPSGHHPERIVWRPQSPEGDLVCLAATRGDTIRFVAWKGLEIPNGYAAVRQDASLDTQERGCQDQAENAPDKCSESWVAYELKDVSSPAEKQAPEGTSPQPPQ